MAAISIRNISKQFDSYEALNDINLEIHDREFMVLLGASGCGKTTLLRIIAGLETASSGEVWIDNRRIDHLPAKDRGISMVFQNYAIFPHLTVAENIGFGLKMAKMNAATITDRVQENAELMHIEQLLSRYSGELSGGQRQRVAVARALAMEPDVILMDEPLSNLDALLRLEMRAELKGVLQRSNTTAIYVTHDQVEAMSLADRVSVMDTGKIVQAADPMELYRNPATHFVAGFIGNPPMNFLKAQIVRSNTWKVAGVEFNGPSAISNELLCAIRPEDVVLATSGLPAEVLMIEPLGPHLLVTVSIAGTPFRAILDVDTQVEVGNQIFLDPIQDRIRWFDPSNNLAVSI
jgi:multiple sugar transport system ATP-binding protein